MTTPTTVPPPATSASSFRTRPSDLTLQVAEGFAERGGDHPAQLREFFIRSRGGDGETPLATVLRGGRGGAVRLKLFLSILFVSKWSPHETAYPSQTWAELLGLEDPQGKGARRIADAIGWLEAHDLLAVQRRAGWPMVLTPMNESMNKEPYRRPWDDDDYYRQIPVSFWTKGWIEILSGPAVAVFLVLLHQHGTPAAAPHDIWLSAKLRAASYGISEDTMGRGIAELKFHDIISVRRRPQGTRFDYTRLRNIYRLNLDALDRGPLFI
jgi:hypothetical protein